MARRQLILAVAVQALVMSVWFATAAVLPSMRADWEISTGAASWLTTAVQIGFVTGAVGSALLNVADRVPLGRLIFAASALAAVTTALVPLIADGLATAIPLRFLTGIALAGVYPAAAKLVASWFAGGRGLAMGILLGALTLGSGMPHLVTAFGELPWRSVLYVTSALAMLGAVASLAFSQGPFASPPGRLQPRYVLIMLSDRAQRSVNLGYFGHMWELYALWTWLPAFLAAAFVAGGSGSSTTEVGLVAFAAIGCAGGLGCVLTGHLARRRSAIGQARGALLLSGACCLLSPVFFDASAVVLIAAVLLWGGAVIADSPMFTTALSRVADQRYVGTALTAQMAIGFLLTAVAIRLVPWVVEAVGWRWAFLFLLPGPMLGLLATRSTPRSATRLRPAAWPRHPHRPAGPRR